MSHNLPQSNFQWVENVDDFNVFSIPEDSLVRLELNSPTINGQITVKAEFRSALAIKWNMLAFTTILTATTA